METHIKAVGIILIALAAMHIFFPKRFNWEIELKPLSLINRQMMIVHTFFIMLTIFLMGVLCITSAAELVRTNFGKKISLGLGIFWSARLIIQFYGYSSTLWKGKSFETKLHILFSLLWIYFSVVFTATYFK